MSEPILTARYANPRLPEHPAAKIRISRGFPKMPLAYRIGGTVMRLAPSAQLLSWSRIGLSDEEFEVLFRRQLAKVNVPQLLADLERIEQHAVVLLCYEDIRDGRACHRRTVARWLEEETGQEVPELDELEVGPERTIVVPEPQPLPDAVPETPFGARSLMCRETP